METTELIEIIGRDEDGKHQFKLNVTNETPLGQEMIAFSNSGGGVIFIGVSDDGTFAELTRKDMWRLNQLVSNAASQQVKPPINPQTENIATPNGFVMRIVVPNGVSRPYMDNNGAIWVKTAGNKKKATFREEIQRLYQSVGLIHGDEIPVPGLNIADLDRDYFKTFFERNFGEPLDERKMPPLSVLLKNMNLMENDIFNVSGALLFTVNPSLRLPVFIVKAITFPGREIHETNYVDSQDITGKIADVFQH